MSQDVANTAESRDEMANSRAWKYVSNTPRPENCTDWNKVFSAATFENGYKEGWDACLKMMATWLVAEQNTTQESK